MTYNILGPIGDQFQSLLDGLPVLGEGKIIYWVIQIINFAFFGLFIYILANLFLMTLQREKAYFIRRIFIGIVIMLGLWVSSYFIGFSIPWNFNNHSEII